MAAIKTAKTYVQIGLGLETVFIPALLLSKRGKRLSELEKRNLSAPLAPVSDNCRGTGLGDGGRSAGNDGGTRRSRG